MTQRITIDHKALLDPEKHRDVALPLTQLILTDNDAMQAAHMLSSVLLQAQITGPEEATEFAHYLRVVGSSLASADAKEMPTFGETLRVLAKVSHNAGMGLDSEIIKKSSGIVVATN